MVVCEICEKEFVVITPLHLKKHNTTIKKYLKKFKGSLIRTPYDCDVCGIEVNYGTSSKSKYCTLCAKDINRLNVLNNVRKYNNKKKRFIEARISEANSEFGITFDDPNSNYRQSRVSPTHSAWDVIPGYMNHLGTINDSDLNENSDGRIKGAVRLKKEIEKLKGKRRQK